MSDVFDVQWLATSNEWDAPLCVWTHADGTRTFRRDSVPPERSAEEPVVWMLLPHAVLIVNGQMCEFDRKRQPGVVKRDENGECIRCIEGCDITICKDCGEDYFAPCVRHRGAGHVSSTDTFDDGSGCVSCCTVCEGKWSLR